MSAWLAIAEKLRGLYHQESTVGARFEVERVPADGHELDRLHTDISAAEDELVATPCAESAGIAEKLRAALRSLSDDELIPSPWLLVRSALDDLVALPA